MALHKSTTPITSLDLWLALGGPKDPIKQWKDGRSAKELARHWLEDRPGQMPGDVEALLRSHPDLGPVLRWHAEPEVKLPFDKFAGEPRNTDLLLTCTDDQGDFLVAVEGKADEAFGATLAETMGAALEERLKSPRSRRIERLVQLVEALMPSATPRGAPVLDSLRYQLFTATAGAMCEAQRRGLTRAVLLVHTFDTPQTTAQLHARNAQDLDRFMARMTAGSVLTVPVGQLLGPFTLPGAPLFDPAVRLYVGTCKTVRRV